MNEHAKDEHLCDLLKGCMNMLSFERAVRLISLLEATKDVPGDIVEFGCFQGRTAMLIAALKQGLKRLWLYDSFEGLPAIPEGETVDAGSFYPGAMRTHPETVNENFRAHNLPLPLIVRGWFKDVTPQQLPDQISFAHIDCDISTSITEALDLVYPRLSKGAICVIDDYNHPGLRGVKPAVDAFVNKHKIQFFFATIQGQADFIKD